MMNYKSIKGFTLSEVLITLGIIGVVAALTIPTLIQNVSNRDVETKLKKFYTTINEAHKFAEAEFGNDNLWFSDTSGPILDNNGNPIEGSSKQRIWFEKYFAKYLKIQKVEVDETGTPIFYFMDGTALSFASHTTRDWILYTEDPAKCLKKHVSIDDAAGCCVFYFNYLPGTIEQSDPEDDYWADLRGKGIVPYKYAWMGSISKMQDNCKPGNNGKYCTALIAMNGWKIPDNYPRKVD